MRKLIPVATATLALSISLAWPGSAAALSDLVLNVDCASGARVGQALSRTTLFDRRLIVVVSGTCTENVTIERDDVVLRGVASGSGVSGADATKPTILINGARRVALEGLTVAGGLSGVKAVGGASIAIRGSVVRGAATHGIFLERGASAEVDGSTFESNVQAGVNAQQASSLTMTGSAVRGNGFSGVTVGKGSHAILGAENAGIICCGNTIENNGLDGVIVFDASSANFYGNTIQGNGSASGRFGMIALHESALFVRGGNMIQGNGSATGGAGVFARASTVRFGGGDVPLSDPTNAILSNFSGIQVLANSNLDLRGGVRVTGSKTSGVFVDQGSRAQSDGSTISNNGLHGILVQRASSVDFFNALTTVTGNTGWGLWCGGSEASYSGSVSQITGNTGGDVNPACTGY